MKLYYHPVSTACRPIMLLAAESAFALEFKLVDLFTGEHLNAPYTAINPSRQVPVLEDGDFRLTESSAILKYLAEKANSPAYPSEPRRRARVNEMMDWFNTGFYRDFGYGFVYPQVLPNHKRPDDKVQAAVIAWAKDKTRGWLKILDENLIGPDNRWLCGGEITIADYFGASILTLGEVIRLNYSPYPNIARWLANMKARPAWTKTNEGFYAHFVAPYKDAPFAGL
jgi:glutathione S-transferase